MQLVTLNLYANEPKYMVTRTLSAALNALVNYHDLINPAFENRKEGDLSYVIENSTGSIVNEIELMGSDRGLDRFLVREFRGDHLYRQWAATTFDGLQSLVEAEINGPCGPWSNWIETFHGGKAMSIDGTEQNAGYRWAIIDVTIIEL